MIYQSLSAFALISGQELGGRSISNWDFFREVSFGVVFHFCFNVGFRSITGFFVWLIFIVHFGFSCGFGWIVCK